MSGPSDSAFRVRVQLAEWEGGLRLIAYLSLSTSAPGVGWGEGETL